MPNSTVNIQNNSYSYYAKTANLHTRKDLKNGRNEEFEYDELDRLTKAWLNGVLKHDMSYHPNGNIDTKSDVGTYKYETPRPHAMSGIDNVGAGVGNDKQFICYTPFNKVSRIEQGLTDSTITKVYDIFYGLDEQRIKTSYDDFAESDKNRVRYYFGTYEKDSDTDGNITNTDYIYSPVGLIAIRKNNVLYYVHTDLLGSIERITNASGAMVSEYAYTPWGGRILLSGVNITDRGYTGHEHLSPFGDDTNSGFCLINMNGRIYDPVLARFLSPDPYVQAPDFTQSFNRYSYGWNNPFKYTDPSGNSIIAAILIGATINLVSQIIAGNVSNFGDAFTAFGIGALGGLVGGVAGQVVSNAINIGGFAAGALSGAASGAASGFVGGAGNAWFNGASFDNGLVQGLKSAGVGMTTGGLIGGVTKGIDAVKNGKANFWDGHVDIDLSNGAGAANIPAEIGAKLSKAYYVGMYEDARVFESKLLGNFKEGSGGLTLPEKGIFVGKGVFPYRNSSYKTLFQHEYGHILQYKQMLSNLNGNINAALTQYYKKIGLPSLKSATFNSAIEHGVQNFEVHANILAKDYFGSSYRSSINFPTTYRLPQMSISNFIYNLINLDPANFIYP